MVVNLSIPDELYADYVKMNPQNPGKAMVKHLKRFVEVRPNGKALVIAGDTLAEVQRIAEKSVDKPEQLLELLKKAMEIKGEGVKISFTDTQRARMRQEAQFWQKDPGVYASEKLQIMVNTGFGV